MNKLPVKRWSMLDTVNLSLLIFVLLFAIDFNKNALLSTVMLLAFGVWIITVIVRNIYISKRKKENHQ